MNHIGHSCLLVTIIIAFPIANKRFIEQFNNLKSTELYPDGKEEATRKKGWCWHRGN